MRRTLILCLALASVAPGCSTQQPKVEIRAISAGPQVRGLAEAEAQLALGNAGTALEGFRRVRRELPSEVRALVGIARSYELMGRHDLTRTWYELALATEPENSALLYALADSLARLGLAADADAARMKAAEVARMAIANSERELLAIAPMDAATTVPPAITVQLPPPRAVVEQEFSSDVATTAPSVTVRLPAPAPVTEVAAGSGASHRLRSALSEGPRLERLSGSEVALITNGNPLWKAQVASASDKAAETRVASLRREPLLLNAARRQGLAALTRDGLLRHGWTKVLIGDAPAVRQSSLVLYPAAQEKQAKQLASELRVDNIRSFNGRSIVVLLGRDIAARKNARAA